MKYRVQFYSYCGMPGLPHEFRDREDARSKAAAVLRARRRAGYQTITLTKGGEWEVLEPDNCLLVPDDCGQLVLRSIPENDFYAEEEEWSY